MVRGIVKVHENKNGFTSLLLSFLIAMGNVTVSIAGMFPTPLIAPASASFDETILSSMPSSHCSVVSRDNFLSEPETEHGEKSLFFVGMSPTVPELS